MPPRPRVAPSGRLAPASTASVGRREAGLQHLRSKARGSERKPAGRPAAQAEAAPCCAAAASRPAVHERERTTLRSLAAPWRWCVCDLKMEPLPCRASRQHTLINRGGSTGSDLALGANDPPHGAGQAVISLWRMENWR